MATPNHQLHQGCRPRPVQVCRRRREVLSVEELTLLAAFPGDERHGVTPEEAATRTGLPRGLAALALELLDTRQL